MNIFQGIPVWEASTSIGAGRSRYQLPITSRPMRQVLITHTATLLDGVGDPEERYWHTDTLSVHLRVRMTAEEIGRLPDGWMDIPAEDRGGHEDRMSRTPPWGLPERDTTWH